MKITFVTPTPLDVAAFGVRTLSAYLKQHGKNVKVIFLPGGVERFKYKSTFKYQYDESILNQVIELCRGSDLVGISFMSNYLDRATQICETLKSELKVPLIAGGIHPTVMPDSCLNFADIVCVGEGEEALLELVERMEAGQDYTNIENLWLKSGNKIIRNPLRPLIQDLDTLPIYDFGPEDHFLYDNVKKRIEPVSKELLRRSFPLEPHVEGSFNDSYIRTVSYKTMTTRGCPHHCTFCAEKTLSDMYAGQRYLRKRSIQHIMKELLWVKKEFPFVESIFLFDDTFLVRPTREIIELSEIYKKKIDLPLHIQVSPTTVTEEKIDALVNAGLAFVEMGIQSTSKTGKELYKRNTPTDSILKAARIFNNYRGKIHPPCYHVILDNPWETDLDEIETLNTILQLPRPFWMKRASLVTFHGTELYIKAKQDGLIKSKEDEWQQIYSKHLHTPKESYINILFYLAGFSYFPRCIIKLLSDKRLIMFFNRESLNKIYSLLNRFGELLITLSKGVRSLLKGDFRRIYRYFVRVTSKTL
jgi:anaerobic magnesium-protoporphyrin IX monomethyl ester cyclase